MKKLLTLLVLLCCFLGFSQHHKILFYKKGVTIPAIHLVDFNHRLVNPISDFQEQIKNKFHLGIFFSPNYTPNTLNIRFSFVNSEMLKNNEYQIDLNGNNLHIKASSIVNFEKATAHFVTNMLQSNKDNSVVYINHINDTQDITHHDFEYREVYFSLNFNQDIRTMLNTQYLELEWGLWGHNIIKWVQKETTTDNIYAFVDGKRNPNQLCFSSTELKEIINKNIELLNYGDPSLKRFMIAPYDNTLVCQCNLCSAKGNTKTNATPAVYSLIEELAHEHPTKSFWSLGYVTTATPPQKPLPQNIGVLLSSINSQEAQPLNKTKKGNTFLKEIAD